MMEKEIFHNIQNENSFKRNVTMKKANVWIQDKWKIDLAIRIAIYLVETSTVRYLGSLQMRAP